MTAADALKKHGHFQHANYSTILQSSPLARTDALGTLARHGRVHVLVHGRPQSLAAIAICRAATLHLPSLYYVHCLVDALVGIIRRVCVGCIGKNVTEGMN